MRRSEVPAVGLTRRRPSEVLELGLVIRRCDDPNPDWLSEVGLTRRRPLPLLGCCKRPWSRAWYSRSETPAVKLLLCDSCGLCRPGVLERRPGDVNDEDSDCPAVKLLLAYEDDGRRRAGLTLEFTLRIELDICEELRLRGSRTGDVE